MCELGFAAVFCVLEDEGVRSVFFFKDDGQALWSSASHGDSEANHLDDTDAPAILG